MKKRQRIFILSVLVSVLLAVSACNMSNEENQVTGNYEARVTGDDWGAGVDRVVIQLDQKVDKVTKDTFVVNEKKEFFNWQKPKEGLSEVIAERTIQDVYLSDEHGSKQEEPSNYVTIDLQISPEEGSYFLLSPDNPYLQYPELYELEISLKDSQKLTVEGKEVAKVTIDPEMKQRETSADAFQVDQYKAEDGTEYQYAHFEAEEPSDTVVVWLHGLTEGGTENTDPYITCLGNKVPTLIGEEFQKTMSGANILVPQCPTYWMDSTGENPLVDNKIISDGSSHYTESLYELITHYKENTNSDKVVIAGCSNGGYMGLLMAMEYGEAFDSYVLICEAMEDQFISDEKINAIKDLSLFFVYSKDDPLVDPTIHEEPTVQRLKEAGASKLQVATFDQIVDTSGRFEDEQGDPHNFGGHSSWVPFFNNEVYSDEGNLNLWEWMSQTVK